MYMGLNLIEADVLRVIEAQIKKLGIRGAARFYKISPAYLNDIQKHRRNISESVARKFGFVRERIVIVTFRKI